MKRLSERSAHELASRYGRQFGVDPKLVLAVMRAESGLDPSARSPKGAAGLMQLMPATARELGVRDAMDPAQNVAGGTRYLRQLLDRFGGDTELALAAYNAGPGAVLRHGGVPPYPETRAYLERVKDAYGGTPATPEPQPTAPPPAVTMTVLEAAVYLARRRVIGPLSLPADPFPEMSRPSDRRLLPQAASTAAQFLGAPTLGTVSSGFGPRRHSVHGRLHVHKGVDIAARTGTAVWATAPGVVVFAGRRGAYGNCIVIDHGGGRETLYAHLDSVEAWRGERVDVGQVIGAVGATGRTTGPNLHYEVRQNGVPIDPGM